MSKKYILPSDIEILSDQNKPIKINGKPSNYRYIYGYGGIRVLYGDKKERVWPDNGANFSPDDDWQDDAKEAIAKHHNSDVSSFEKTKAQVKLFSLATAIKINFFYSTIAVVISVIALIVAIAK